MLKPFKEKKDTSLKVHTQVYYLITVCHTYSELLCYYDFYCVQASASIHKHALVYSHCTDALLQ